MVSGLLLSGPDRERKRERESTQELCAGRWTITLIRKKVCVCVCGVCVCVYVCVYVCKQRKLFKEGGGLTMIMTSIR